VKQPPSTPIVPPADDSDEGPQPRGDSQDAGSAALPRFVLPAGLVFARFSGYQNLQSDQPISQRQLLLKIEGTFAQPLRDGPFGYVDFTLRRSW
jgi:hypothetical protein